MRKAKETMKVIRYSKGFKLQMVREVEAGKLCVQAVQRKYNIKGCGTVMSWVRQFGSGRYGKIIRVERVDEIDEAARLRSQVRQLKEVLADTQVELALEKAFLGVACEQLQQSLEEFKKKHAGRRHTGRSRHNRSSK